MPFLSILQRTAVQARAFSITAAISVILARIRAKMRIFSHQACRLPFSIAHARAITAHLATIALHALAVLAFKRIFRTTAFGTAIIRIRVRLDAVAIATDTALATILQALTAIAELPFLAGMAAFGAVAERRLEIIALPVTFLLPLRTERLTNALTAHIAILARVIALTTVRRVCLQVHAFLATRRLAARARNTAHAIHAEKPFFARLSAFTAVRRIRLQIHAQRRRTVFIRTITIILALDLRIRTRQLASPVHTHGTAGTHIATVTAVARIRLHLRARFITDLPAILAAELARAIFADRIHAAPIAAIAAITRIRLHIRAYAVTAHLRSIRARFRRFACTAFAGPPLFAGMTAIAAVRHIILHILARFATELLRGIFTGIRHFNICAGAIDAMLPLGTL